MAEAYFRHRVAELGLSAQISVDSAGIGGWHQGEPADFGTRQTLEHHHISSKGLIARKIHGHDCAFSDYIVVMDRSHLRALNSVARGKARLLMSWTPGRAAADEVFDPYGTERFEELYALITPALDQLLAEIVTTHGLDTLDRSPRDPGCHGKMT
jgi:protein-tyrosine phosphatase